LSLLLLARPSIAQLGCNWRKQAIQNPLQGFKGIGFALLPAGKFLENVLGRYRETTALVGPTENWADLGPKVQRDSFATFNISHRLRLFSLPA
jgi:hypothetical protein